MLTFAPVWMPAWTSASVSDLYDSVRSTYLPTMPIVTSDFGCSRLWTSLSHTDRSAGEAVMLETLADEIVETLLVQHRRDLVDRVGVPHRDDAIHLDVREQRYLRALVVGNRAIGTAQEHVGLMPISRSFCTLCCVGLVFSSPADAMKGTSVRCRKQTEDPRPPRRLIWRAASRNGSDSMSPTVPPISTSAMSGPPSSG